MNALFINNIMNCYQLPYTDEVQKCLNNQFICKDMNLKIF